MKAFFHKNWITLSCLISVGFLLVAYFSQYFTGDLLVSFGAAHQADLLEGSMLDKLLNSWNLRGFGYKLILYFDYKTIHWFFPNLMFLNPVGFMLAYKVLHLFFIALVLWVSYWVSKKNLKKLNVNPIWLIIPILIGLFSSNFMMIGQPEEYAFMFTILLTALWISNKPILQIVGG